MDLIDTETAEAEVEAEVGAELVPPMPEAAPAVDYYYSASTGGFYVPGIHDSMPADVVGVAAAHHADLMAGQIRGGRIEPGPDGLPQVVHRAVDAQAAARAAMVCSRFQARAALHLAGLLEAAEAAVAQADPMTRLAWADAQEFRRTSPTIAALAGPLGLDDAALDQLFRTAMAISA